MFIANIVCWTEPSGLKRLFDLAKKYQMEAVALTDHGNMFGAIEFYQKAIQHGIKPIVGCEVYVAPGSRFEKKTGTGGEGPYHLTLLVKNRDGLFQSSEVGQPGPPRRVLLQAQGG